MALDINYEWTTFNFYGAFGAGEPAKLLPDMNRPATRYLTAGCVLIVLVAVWIRAMAGWPDHSAQDFRLRRHIPPGGPRDDRCDRGGTATAGSWLLHGRAGAE
ncbi:MAG: hypothetical protein ACLP4R_29660 [Solirubrobacteraceae bacterium]